MRPNYNNRICAYTAITFKFITSDHDSGAHTTMLLLAACYQPLEQFVSRNSRCTVSKCFQETLGISATEEDGLLHRLLVRTTLLAATYARYDVICLCYMMIAFGAATPREL